MSDIVVVRRIPKLNIANSSGGDMTAYQALAILVGFYVVLGVSHLVRDSFEYGGAAIISAVIYPVCTHATVGWWLVFATVAVVATVIFTVRKRLTFLGAIVATVILAVRTRLVPAVASAWRWLSAPYPDGAHDRTKWR